MGSVLLLVHAHHRRTKLVEVLHVLFYRSIIHSVSEPSIAPIHSLGTRLLHLSNRRAAAAFPRRRSRTPRSKHNQFLERQTSKKQRKKQEGRKLYGRALLIFFILYQCVSYIPSVYTLCWLCSSRMRTPTLILASFSIISLGKGRCMFCWASSICGCRETRARQQFSSRILAAGLRHQHKTICPGILYFFFFENRPFIFCEDRPL